MPYGNAASGERAVQDAEDPAQFRLQQVGHLLDYEHGELLVQFEYRGQQVTVRASSAGYAAAWLEAHPYSARSRAEYERKAQAIGAVAAYSILRIGSRGRSPLSRPAC